MNLIIFFTIFIFGPIPLFHFLLHLFIKFWKENPVLFYLIIFLLWGLAGFIGYYNSLSPNIIFTPIKWLNILSIITISSSVFIVFWSIKTLGIERYFLLAPLKPKIIEHKLIKKGPYKHLSHPAYVAYVMIMVSSFLLTGCTILLFFSIYYILTIPIIIKLEEHELQKRLKK